MEVDISYFLFERSFWGFIRISVLQDYFYIFPRTPNSYSYTVDYAYNILSLFITKKLIVYLLKLCLGIMKERVVIWRHRTCVE